MKSLFEAADRIEILRRVESLPAESERQWGKMSAAQMLEFRKPLKPGAGAQQAFEIVRSYVAKLDHDRVLSPDINALALAIHREAFEIIE